MTTSIYDLYFNTQKEYEKKYGKNAIVLMEKGSFFEIYEYDLPTFKCGHCKHLCQVIGSDPNVGQELKLARVNGNKPHAIKNPYMVGVPKVVFEKWKSILIQRGFIIVKMEQFDIEGQTKKHRKVTEVITVGTDINGLSDDISSTIVCVYIESHKQTVNECETLISCGASALDLVTGKTFIIEVTSTFEEPLLALNTLNKFLSTYNPRETVVYLKGFDNIVRYTSFMKKYLNLPSNTAFYKQTPCEFFKIAYQELMLKKIFQLQSPLDPLEQLELAKLRWATVSYLALLQYCYEHNESIVKKINPPTLEEDGVMMLPQNTVDQLNVISNNQLELRSDQTSVKSIFSIIDFTRTNMGKRKLKHLLTHPYTNPQTLVRIYNLVEVVKPNVQKIDPYLSLIPDIERYHRKLALKTITPAELCSLITNGYTNILQIFETLQNVKKILPSQSIVDKFKQLTTKLNNTFDFDLLSKCVVHVGKEMFFDLFEPPFKIKSSNNCYDKLVEWHFMRYKTKIYKEKERYDTILKKDSVAIEVIDDVVYITTTEARAKKIKAADDKVDYEKIKGGKVHLFSEQTKIIHTRATIVMRRLRGMCYKMYLKQLDYIQTFDATLRNITSSITNVDYISSIVKCSQKYNYHRPTIIKSDHSFINIQGIRHPIIERIIDEEYVTNDVMLAQCDKPSGMLLYGPNSIGKTSLAKAVGCCVLLAQIGYYVPAKMKFYPYNKILTRLSGNDNLYKGQSSFVVEMVELRTILKNYDDRTLVLADELCRGTETISGTSLVIAAVLSLLRSKCTFIISTHMHHIPQHPEIKSATNLLIKHLQIVRDAHNNLLVYDRKLKDGPGSSYYGLDIAESLDLDKDFIKKAKSIRREIADIKEHFVQRKSSHYNTKIYVDECVMCGSSKTLDTHHIREQRLADANKFIDHVPKNSKGNLVVVCKRCHQKTHHNNIKIVKKMTNKGIQIMF